MPKIIENLEEKLMAECIKQIQEAGYSAMTIRSVAKACGVGIGTVYNYFSSKDELVAAFMLKDWQESMLAITKASEVLGEPMEFLAYTCEQLQHYIMRYRNLFQDKAAVLSFSASVGQYHSMLRSQLAAPLRKFCKDYFQAEFITEALLTWTVAGKSFEELAPLLQKLF